MGLVLLLFGLVVVVGVLRPLPAVEAAAAVGATGIAFATGCVSLMMALVPLCELVVLLLILIPSLE